MHACKKRRHGEKELRKNWVGGDETLLTSTGTSEQTCISPTTSCCIFTFLSTGGLEPVPLGLRSPSPHRQRECGPPSHRELWKARNERKMAEEGADVCTSHPSPGPLHFQIHAIYSVLQEHVSVFTLQYSAKKLPSNNQEARDEFTDLHSGYVLKLTIASYPALQRLFNINDGLKRVRTRYHRSIGNCRTSKRCKGRYAMYLTSARRV